MALYQPLRTPQTHPRGRLPWGVVGVSSIALTRDGDLGTVNRYGPALLGYSVDLTVSMAGVEGLPCTSLLLNMA